MRTALILVVALACALLSPAWRHEARAQAIGVRCTIESVTSVDFGNYDPDSAREQNTTGRLRFNCEPPDRLTVQVTIGPSAVTGSIAERAMREVGGADLLRYNLFQDRRATVVWGDGVTGGSAAFVDGKRGFTVEIFGLAPPRQNVSEGTYADVLRITILP